MNNLAMVQRLRQETDYANTGPSTVTGQVGDHARAVSWIADAYTELQGRHPWRWLRNGFTLTTTAADSTYQSSDAIDDASAVAITRFKEWHVDDPCNPPRIYLQSSGAGTEYWLTYIPWDQYQAIYKIGTFVDSSPSHITVDPHNNLVLGPAPGDTYVISSEYHRSAQVLTENTDIPEMPEEYHMMIVYLAMQDHGYYEGAEEILGRGTKKYRKLLRQLEGNQGPVMQVAGPMV